MSQMQHVVYFIYIIVIDKRNVHIIKKTLLFCVFVPVTVSDCVQCSSSPLLSGLGGKFIDGGLDNLFCLSVNCDVDSVFLLYQQALRAACLLFLENK